MWRFAHCSVVVENATAEQFPKWKQLVSNIFSQMAEKKDKIIIYKSKQGEIKVSAHFVDETIWLTQNQIADLFNVDVRTINEHLINIFRTGELPKGSTIRNFRIVRSEGKRKVEREIAHYNLDAIISVGYRVNSKKATDFRIWATQTLKKYLTKGYAINEKRLETAEENFLEARRLILMIGEKSKSELLQGHEKDLLGIVNEYARSLQLLDQYDQGKIKIRKTKTPVRFEISYDGALELVGSMKESLSKLKVNLYLFGNETGEKLRSVIGAVNQTYCGKDLYSCIADKAANLFYLVIKDHPFTDGNKRIASVLFLYFLGSNNFLYNKAGENKINNSTLATLAILVASSEPSEKEAIIKLITKLLEDF